MTMSPSTVAFSSIVADQPKTARLPSNVCPDGSVNDWPKIV